jgi:superfamily I DNA/RNA helicase
LKGLSQAHHQIGAKLSLDQDHPDAAKAVAHNKPARKIAVDSKTGGDPVTLWQAPDAENEAPFVAQQILCIIACIPTRVSVLYRTNFHLLFE